MATSDSQLFPYFWIRLLYADSVLLLGELFYKISEEKGDSYHQFLLHFKRLKELAASTAGYVAHIHIS